MSQKISLAILFLFFTLLVIGQDKLISYGSVWSYYDNGDAPANQSALNWTEVDYDDSSWASGATHMGYGDNDEATVVNTATKVFYTRHTFDIADPSEYNRLSLDIIYDDGAVVYLNGQEVSRLNMPTGNITASTFASSVSPDNTSARAVILNKLLVGENVIAVEIHQESNTSSDLSFNLELSPFSLDLGFTQSTLPLIFITVDDNKIIQDEPKVDAQMQIIYNEDGSPNMVNQSEFHFDGRIGVELRGQSSLSLFPKKGYGLETRDSLGEDMNVELLGFPKESDYVIHSPYSDKSLIRNALTYHLAGQIMPYAPRIKMCELIVNNNYQGIVLFTEKIKRDKNRVDISKLTPEEVEGDDVTGGYIIKFDKSTPDEVGWESSYIPISGRSARTEFIYNYPKARNISAPQKAYIKDYVTKFENALSSSNFDAPTGGFRDYADPTSFIHMFIMNEISRNVDGYRLSTYMYKDKESDGGKLTMGPVWDYNLAYGNADYCNGSNISGWAYEFNTVCPGDRWVNHFWWKRLLEDEVFKQDFKDTYFYLRKNILSNHNIDSTITSLTRDLEPAISRNFERWPVLGRYIWPNNFIGSTYDSEVFYLKSWIWDRLKWLDENIQGFTTDIEEITISSDISVYPNPAHDMLHIKSEIDIAKVDILNLQGQLIISTTGQNVIDLKSINHTEYYLVKILTTEGDLYSSKVLVRR